MRLYELSKFIFVLLLSFTFQILVAFRIRLKKKKKKKKNLDPFFYFISDVFLWTPTYGRAKARRPARTYIQQLCEDTGCSPEDLPEAMNDREKWRERVRDICASGTT